jgi:hypothetical protein
MAEVDPEADAHQTDRPSGGADRPPPGTKWAQLLECSSTAYEDQSKPQVKVGLIVRCPSSPLDYISRPLTLGQTTIHSIKSSMAI